MDFISISKSRIVALLAAGNKKFPRHRSRSRNKRRDDLHETTRDIS